MSSSPGNVFDIINGQWTGLPDTEEQYHSLDRGRIFFITFLPIVCCSLFMGGGPESADTERADSSVSIRSEPSDPRVEKCNISNALPPRITCRPLTDLGLGLVDPQTLDSTDLPGEEAPAPRAESHSSSITLAPLIPDPSPIARRKGYTEAAKGARRTDMGLAGRYPNAGVARRLVSILAIAKPFSSSRELSICCSRPTLWRE